MTRIERSAPDQFHAADSTDDWRVISEGACAFLPHRLLAAGARLVQAIGVLPGGSSRAIPTSTCGMTA
jgi:4a-hydroxytetrahydrobiopterin dehydratase